jgi:predicted RNase H-like nuclease (RuvC/YqgF family)
MVNFDCPRCGFQTDHKTNIINHIERKKVCKATNLDVSLIEYREQILDRTFIKIYNLIKENDNLKKVNETQTKKIEKLENEVSELKTKIVSKMGNSNVIGNHNNIININLTAWDNPNLNLEDIKKYYEQATKKLITSIPLLIKSIHFNSKHPENHNMCIKNARTKLAKVFDGEKWRTVSEDEIISAVIDSCEDLLEFYSNDNFPSYNVKINEMRKRDIDESIKDDIKTEVKKILYDNRGMVNVKN